jgi:hypothetical protein
MDCTINRGSHAAVAAPPPQTADVTEPCPGTGSHHIYDYYHPVPTHGQGANKGIGYDTCWKDPDDDEGVHHIIRCPACGWTASAGIDDNRQIISLYWVTEDEVWLDDDETTDLMHPHSKPFVRDPNGEIDHLPM